MPLFCKQTLNHLAKLDLHKWLSSVLRTVCIAHVCMTMQHAWLFVYELPSKQMQGQSQQ